jgi:hypothetical protein
MTTFQETLSKLRQLPDWLWDQAFTKIEDLHTDSEQTLRYANEEVDPGEGNLITSRITAAKQLVGSGDPWAVEYEKHRMRLLLDIDMPVYVRETSPGKYHLAIDRVITRDQHDEIVRALKSAGILQRGFADSALGSDLGACLRPPWVSKDDLDEAKATQDRLQPF